MTKLTFWGAIDTPTRPGCFSVLAIGESHGVNHAPILMRAKGEDWRREE